MSESKLRYEIFKTFINKNYNIDIDIDELKAFEDDQYKNFLKTIKPKKKIIIKAKKHTNTIENRDDYTNLYKLNNLKGPKKKIIIKKACKPSKPLKKKKKILIKKNMSIYKKFIDTCKEYEIEYFRYKNKYCWEGPCVKTNEREGITIDMLESIFEIDVVKHQIAFSYLIHPKIFEDPNCIEYPEDVNRNKDIIDVEEWIFNNVEYNVDIYTGNLYDDEGEHLGKRKVVNGKYTIELLDEDSD